VIIADTNVVSELMRTDPAEAVLSWVSSVSPHQLAITVITITEIEYGLARLPDGQRKRDVATAWRRVLNAHSERLLEYGTEAAHTTAEVLAERIRAGHPMSLADAQIAGICRSLNYRLATRNTKDFLGLGLVLINPFQGD
jgi:predicted nucleic acid-binding protein